MGLKMDLIRGIYSYGFEKPSPIQEQAIPAVLTNKDIIAQAQSGTGKTGAFIISALQQIDETKKTLQCIIISPTRELSTQIKTVFDNLSNYMKNVSSTLCIGGTNIKDSIKDIKKGCQVVIGTPGRISYLIEQGNIKKENISLLILDEADEMLSESFQEQIKYVIQKLNKEIQICIFSATMPENKLEFTKYFMNDPQVILVKKEQITLDGISQFYIYSQKEDYKFDILCSLYSTISVSQSIIYVNTKNKASHLATKLTNSNFTVSVIHSDMTTSERTEVMQDFRKGRSRILISTDLLARGIDIQQVSIVLNYDIPFNKENYIHRIGRGGRYGRKGVAINFVTERDLNAMRILEKHYCCQIAEMPENINSFL
jgi:translation initiation factor 4A